MKLIELKKELEKRGRNAPAEMEDYSFLHPGLKLPKNRCRPHGEPHEVIIEDEESGAIERRAILLPFIRPVM